MSKEHCCCGFIHVRIGALIIGSLILFFGINGLLASVSKDNGEGIVSNVLNVIIGGCIIYADKSRKPGGYLPYLILSAIGIVTFTIFIIFFAIMAIAAPSTLLNYLNDYNYRTQHQYNYIDPKTATTGSFLFVAVVLAFIDWIAIWLWMVVYRAYQYMKGVEEYDRGQTYQVKLNHV